MFLVHYKPWCVVRGLLKTVVLSRRPGNLETMRTWSLDGGSYSVSQCVRPWINLRPEYPFNGCCVCELKYHWVLWIWGTVLLLMSRLAPRMAASAISVRMCMWSADEKNTMWMHLPSLMNRLAFSQLSLSLDITLSSLKLLSCSVIEAFCYEF